ncbi:MAG: hypothetical protein EAX95_12315 [Candidatus Thorarchaeota archaeon]|nr:hypothetical protein [Candidatus Thorarchaeota archaeon]
MTIMVDLIFGNLTSLDVILAVTTGFVATVVVVTAYSMSERGIAKWKSRKLVHASMGTVIALTVMAYSNLSGPALAAGIFLTILLYAWAHKPDLISELLLAGSREGDERLGTFAAGFMGLLSFALVFIFFNPRPEILISSILAVSWADAAGEVFGRPFGGKFVKRRFRNKSVEGTIAVFIFAMLSVMVSLVTYSSDTLPLDVLPQIIAIAFAISLTEVFSMAWTDNFLIPFVTAVLMWQLMFPAMSLIVQVI